MIKYDMKNNNFKYYNENGEHEFINAPTFEQAAKIIYDLMRCPEFQYDSTILSALYMGMQKLSGISDKHIKRLMN